MGSWGFEILKADERRILEVQVERLLGGETDEDDPGRNGKKNKSSDHDEEDNYDADDGYAGPDDIVDEQGNILVEKIESMAVSAGEKRTWKIGSDEAEQLRNN